MINKYRKFQFGENETLDGLTDTYNLNKERFYKMETCYTSKAKIGLLENKVPKNPMVFQHFPSGASWGHSPFSGKTQTVFLTTCCN
jgi:hypothetical protein